MTDHPPLTGSRARVANELAAALAAVARRARIPLAVACVLPVPPALFLLALAVVADGWYAWAAGGGGLAGLGVAAWLTLRRRQLRAAADPVEALAGDVAHAIDVADAWAEGRQAVERIRAIGERGWGPIKILKALWTGLRFGQGLLERVAERPRLAPFTPARLHGIVSLTVACAVVAAVSVLFGIAGVVLLATGVT